MPQGYTYDVFISYRHKRPVLDWVNYHFHPLLEQWLPQFMPYNYEPKIFIDLKIETGTEWPAKLRQALLMSRCLLPIWSPDYFRSEWCQAELQTMLQREQQLGLRSDQNPSGLIYAVLYACAECLPSTIQTIQCNDLSKWNSPYAHFNRTPKFLNFDREVQLLCQELAKMIQSAPPWQTDWPVMTPKISSSVTFSLPRLQ